MMTKDEIAACLRRATALHMLHAYSAAIEACAPVSEAIFDGQKVFASDKDLAGFNQFVDRCRVRAAVGDLARQAAKAAASGDMAAAAQAREIALNTANMKHLGSHHLAAIAAAAM